MYQIRDLKKRIKTINNIGHITKAMKTLASAKIKRSENRTQKAELYSGKLQELVGELVHNFNPLDSPFTAPREGNKYLLVVMTADVGFAASFNHTIIHSALDFIGYHKPGSDIFIIAMGKKIITSLKRRKIPVEMAVPHWKDELITAKVVADKCIEMFLEEKVDRVLVLYSKPAKGFSPQAYRDTFLPISFEEEEDGRRWKKRKTFFIEPSPEEAVDMVFPHYLVVKMYRMMCETRLGELGARIQSMSSATDNAEKLNDELTLQYYRARQESITREILEITSAKESLE